MEAYDPRVDAYIEQAQPFAQPILQHLRELLHRACPEVRETIKWGMPFFDYRGPLCNMASFKQHAAFGFWKGKLLADPQGILMSDEGENAAMGHLGKLTSIADMPKEKVLTGLIREAMKLNESGIKAAAKPASKKAEILEPDYVTVALQGNAAAKRQWEAFAPSHRREYLEWITEAKTAPTRQKRLATMLDWLTEGKQRHWKYQK